MDVFFQSYKWLYETEDESRESIIICLPKVKFIFIYGKEVYVLCVKFRMYENLI